MKAMYMSRSFMGNFTTKLHNENNTYSVSFNNIKQLLFLQLIAQNNEESIFVTLGCFSISLTYRCASCLAYACQKQALYKQLGVTVNQLCLWCRL